MKHIRIAILVTLTLCVCARMGTAQSFWCHTAIYGNTGIIGQYLIAAADTASYVFAQGVFYPARSDDYGNHWSFIFLDTGSGGYHNRNYSIIGLARPTRNRVLLGCNDHSVGFMMKSTDAGVTWRNTMLGSYAKAGPKNTVLAMAALDSSHFFVLTNGDSSFLSSDGGDSWQPFHCPVFPSVSPQSGLPNNPIVGYPAPDVLLVAAIAAYPNSVIYRSTDMGTTWDTGLQTAETITKFAFLNSRIGFSSGMSFDLNAQSETAVIARTTDGGLTWTRIFSQPGDGLYSIAFADSLDGFASGDHGLILRTSDAGASWAQMTSDFTIDAQGDDLLGSVVYPDTDHAMIASSDGSILKYQPNGILSLPNITYPKYSPPSTPRTLDVTWDPVPGATRYSLMITTSGYPDSNTALVLKDTNVTSTFYHLSNLVDTSPPPGQGGRQYEIYLQAFNATNESNIAKRAFIVDQSFGVSRIFASDSSVAVYPDPAANWLSVMGFDGPVIVLDVLGRTQHCRWQSGKMDVAALAPGIYYVSDGHQRTRFVKQ